MALYSVRTHVWLRLFYPKSFVWQIPPTTKPAVYLTFDDGPHPVATPFVLEQLEKYNAKATFFCVGNNVHLHPDLFQKLIEGGHKVGNHTYDHKKGWKTDLADYMENIEKADVVIGGNLFRPPYGKIKIDQAKALISAGKNIIMWSLLTGDFDNTISPEKCLKNVLDSLRPGDIVIFHDSAKAFDRMCYALPKVLEYCKTKNWQMNAIPN